MSNPTLGVWQLAEDLDGQTPSGAVALVGVDPIRFDAGLWLEEGTTNLIVNNSAETNTTGWIASGTSTVERVLGSSVGVVPQHGDYVFKATRNNNNNVFGYSITLPGAGTYTYRLPIWIPAAANPTVFTVVRISSFTGSSVVSEVQATLSLRDQWQDVRITFTADAGDLAGFLVFDFAATAGEFVYLDAPQCENKDHDTSFAESSLGDGYSAGGGGTHVRAASSAALDPTGILDPASGALAFRATPTVETGVEEIWGECGVKGAGTDHLRWGRDATKHPFVEWSANDAAYSRLTATETIDAGTQAFIYLGHDGTDITLQVNAGSLQADTRNAVEDDLSTGDLTLRASAGGVIYGPFAAFDRELTASERAKLSGSTNWSMSTLGGNRIIMPLSRRRRR